jgi:hypothetical protein
MAERHKYLEFGNYKIAQRCNAGGINGTCANRPAVFTDINYYTYYGRCSDHAALYFALRNHYSLDDVKADIAMKEL